jgi:hypothetical protein
MDELNPLGAIGLGLSAAGGALNQNVYNQNANFYSQQQAQRLQKQKFIADLLTDHFQKGTLAGDVYQQAMAKNGTPVPPMQQPIDYASEAADVMERFDRQEQRPLSGLRPSDSLRTPTAPSLDIKTEGVDQPSKLGVNDVPVADTNEVSGLRTMVYGPEEMNARIHAFADVLKKSGGSTKEKRQAMNDFVNKMKLENAEQLKEATLLQQIKHQQAMEKRERTPAFIQELEYWKKLPTDDPAYKILTDKITRDAQGNKTAIRKNIEQDMIAQNIKEGTEQWDEEFHRRMSAYLTNKSSRPGAETTKLSEGIGPLAWKSLLFGKNPPGMGNASASQRAEVANKVAEIGHKLGLSDAEIATLPENNKAKMKAVDKLTTWGAFVDVASERLTKTIDVAIEYVKKLDPDRIKRLNKAIIAGETEFNDPIANAYAVQVNIIRQDYGRLTTGPTSNAMLPVEAIKKGDELISTGFDLPTWNEVKKSLLRDAKITRDSVSEQKNSLLETIKDPGKKSDKTGTEKTNKTSNQQEWKIEKVQ